jgi:hypothetical protein
MRAEPFRGGEQVGAPGRCSALCAETAVLLAGDAHKHWRTGHERFLFAVVVELVTVVSFSAMVRSA